jgi:hypothetical protein
MMKKSESPFVAYIIGPPESERYVIKDNRVDYPRFFAGTDDEEWTDDLRNSRKYFNIDDLSEALQGLAKREMSHLAQRNYRMDVEGTVIGEATEDQLRIANPITSRFHGRVGTAL